MLFLILVVVFVVALVWLHRQQEGTDAFERIVSANWVRKRSRVERAVLGLLCVVALGLTMIVVLTEPMS